MAYKTAVPPATSTFSPTTTLASALSSPLNPEKDLLSPTTTAAGPGGRRGGAVAAVTGVSCTGVTAATAGGRIPSPQNQLAQLLLQQQQQQFQHATGTTGSHHHHQHQHHRAQSSSSTTLSNSVASLTSTIAASGLVLLPPPPLTVKNLTIHTSLLSTKQHLLQQQQQLHQLHHAQLDAALKKQQQEHQQQQIQMQQLQQLQQQNHKKHRSQGPPQLQLQSLSVEECAPCASSEGRGYDDIFGLEETLGRDQRRKENASMGFVGHGDIAEGEGMSPSQPTSRSTTRVTSPVPGGAQGINGSVQCANNVVSTNSTNSSNTAPSPKPGSSTFFLRGDICLDQYPPPDQWTYTMTRYHTSLIPLCQIEEPPSFYEAMDDHPFEQESDKINVNNTDHRQDDLDDSRGEEGDSFALDEDDADRDSRERDRNKNKKVRDIGQGNTRGNVEERGIWEDMGGLSLFSKPHFHFPDQQPLQHRDHVDQGHLALQQEQQQLQHQHKQPQQVSQPQQQQTQQQPRLSGQLLQQPHQQQQFQPSPSNTGRENISRPTCPPSNNFNDYHKSNHFNYKHNNDNDNTTYTNKNNNNHHQHLHDKNHHDQNLSLPSATTDKDNMTTIHASSASVIVAAAEGGDTAVLNLQHHPWESPSTLLHSPLIRYQRRRERTQDSSGEHIFFYDGPNLLQAKIYRDRDWDDHHNTTQAYVGTASAMAHSNEPLNNRSHGRQRPPTDYPTRQQTHHPLSQPHPYGDEPHSRSRSRSRSLSSTRSRSKSNTRSSPMSPLFPTEDSMLANGKVSQAVAGTTVSRVSAYANDTAPFSAGTICDLDVSKLDTNHKRLSKSSEIRSQTMSEAMLRKEEQLYYNQQRQQLEQQQYYLKQTQQQHLPLYQDKNEDPQLPWPPISYPSSSLSAATGSKKAKTRPSILTRGFSAESAAASSRKEKEKEKDKKKHASLQATPIDLPKGNRFFFGTVGRKATAKERLVAMVTRSTPPQAAVAPLMASTTGMSPSSWNGGGIGNESVGNRTLGTSIHSHRSGNSNPSNQGDDHAYQHQQYQNHQQHQQQQQPRSSSRQSYSPTILTQTHHRRQGSPTFVRSPESSFPNHTIGPSSLAGGAGSYFYPQSQHHPHVHAHQQPHHHQQQHHRQLSSPMPTEPVLGFPYNNSSLLTDLHRSPPSPTSHQHPSSSSPLAFATVRGSTNSMDRSASSSPRRLRSQKPRPFSVATMEKVMSHQYPSVDHHHRPHRRGSDDRRFGDGSGSEDNEMDLASLQGLHGYHNGYSHQYLHPHHPLHTKVSYPNPKQKHMSVGGGGGGGNRPWADILLLPITSLMNITRTNSTISSSRTKEPSGEK